MKIIKFISFAIFAIISLIFIFPNHQQADNEYLRIHIRANSNLECDQNIKYEIKDYVVDYLTPYLIDVHSKQDAIKVISNLLDEIEAVCDNVLEQNGFSYKSNAKINNEEFPTRAYDDFVLDAGFYDALIIELGSGMGNNWWCVVYPPLCFVNKNDNSSQNIKYKSKIMEIIEEFLN